MIAPTGLATPQDPQLLALQSDLDSATVAARRLAESVTDEMWGKRPTAETWCIAECIIHLNLTSRVYIPAMRKVIEEGRAQQKVGKGPYGRDWLGRLLEWTLEPPYRMKTKTTPGFTPPNIDPKAKVLAEFEALQDELKTVVQQSEGLALDKLIVVSSFNAKVKYNLYSAFRITTAHQRRHLWQAERIRKLFLD
jgi:hypothetical protein